MITSYGLFPNPAYEMHLTTEPIEMQPPPAESDVLGGVYSEISDRKFGVRPSWRYWIASAATATAFIGVWLAIYSAWHPFSAPRIEQITPNIPTDQKQPTKSMEVPSPSTSPSIIKQQSQVSPPLSTAAPSTTVQRLGLAQVNGQRVDVCSEGDCSEKGILNVATQICIQNGLGHQANRWAVTGYQGLAAHWAGRGVRTGSRRT